MDKIIIPKEQLILSDNPNTVIGKLLKNAGYRFQSELHKVANPRNLTIEYYWNENEVHK